MALFRHPKLEGGVKVQAPLVLLQCEVGSEGFLKVTQTDTEPA